MESKVTCIPKLDFSRIKPGNTAAWNALQSEVMHALELFGCFEVVYDRVTPELQDVLFGRIWPEIFDLPLDMKLLTKCDLPMDGYIGQIPGFSYESLLIPDDGEKFSRLFWPQGNLTFCDTVSTFSRHMKDLERIIVRMLFLGLGIEKYYDSYTESTVYGTRAAEYGTSLDKERKITLTKHVDPTIISIIGQSLEGLEIQTKEGEWMPIMPSRNSYTVIIGDTIQAWTNGRIQATYHRVRNPDNEKRYSVTFESLPKKDCIIQTPNELVDEEHPLIYKPHVFGDQVIFRYAGGGGANRTLYDFCGIREEERLP